MSVHGLQMLCATVVCDRHHRAALLAGQAHAYTGFDLTAVEIAALQAIPAATLEDFAWHAHRLFYGEVLPFPTTPTRFPPPVGARDGLVPATSPPRRDRPAHPSAPEATT